MLHAHYRSPVAETAAINTTNLETFWFNPQAFGVFLSVGRWQPFIIMDVSGGLCVVGAC